MARNEKSISLRVFLSIDSLYVNKRFDGNCFHRKACFIFEESIINNSFRVGVSKWPNFIQPEIREHQLSSRLIWKQSRKKKFGHFPLLEQLFFLVTRRYFQGKS